MKFFGLFVVLALAIQYCNAQADTIQLAFVPSFGESELKKGKAYFLKNSEDSIRVHTFRFYVSDVTLLKNGLTAHCQRERFHLLDIEGALSILVLADSLLDFDQLQFKIGVDSLTNVSGAFGGDLDPTNGMYWAWQSGYINFKLEGVSNRCMTRNNQFQFHVGGYMPPFETLRTITCPVKRTSKIEVLVDIKKLVARLDLSTVSRVMSPGEQAVKLADLYSSIFSCQE